MEPTLIFWGALIFSWIACIWDRYLSYRQYKVCVANEKRPENVSEIISEEDYCKSRGYSIDKTIFGNCHAIYDQLESTLVLLTGLLPILWGYSGELAASIGFNGEISQSLMFLCLTQLISFFIGMPWSLYSTFVIEEKHGFNKETLPFFIKDRIKKLGISMALTMPIVSGIIWIIKAGGEYFFIYVWVFMTVIIFVFMTIYPEFIAPIFDKYTPLKEGTLRTKIEALADKLQFPLKKLYVVEGSKRSAHSNAYLYGLWNNKRIVLYDTLIEDYSTEEKKEDEAEDVSEEKSGAQGDSGDEDPCEKKVEDKSQKKLGMKEDEVVAVLGHELGHWKLNHTIWNLVTTETNMFLVLAVFAYLYPQKSLYLAFGFNTQPTLIGLLVILQYIFAPYNEVLSFLMTFWTRMKEFEADKFSAELGYASLLQSGLIKLGKDNLSFPVDDWLYSFFNHDHPPIPERIAVLNKYK